MDKVIRLLPKFNPEKNAYKPLKQWREVWKEIAELRPQSRYLPNLRCLRINNVAEELLIPLIGIAGANLVHLYIKYIHNPESESLVQKILRELQDTPKLAKTGVPDGTRWRAGPCSNQVDSASTSEAFAARPSDQLRDQKISHSA
jgi:hypothetical protein